MGEEFPPVVCKTNLHMHYCRFKIMPVHLARLKHFRFVNVVIFPLDAKLKLCYSVDKG